MESPIQGTFLPRPFSGGPFRNAKRMPMGKLILWHIPFTLLLFFTPIVSGSSAAADRDRVLNILKEMKSQGQQIQDYSCEVEQVYFLNDEEKQRIYFTYSFKKGAGIRIDFSYPQAGVTVFYKRGEEKATILPARAWPGLKFRVSVQNPLLRTFTGQRIDQTDMGYFIDFLESSLMKGNQQNFDLVEGKEEVTFLLLARDYVEGKNPEKYRVTLSKAIWLPLHIERYSLEDIPIEKSILRNYILNAHPQDQFFTP
jgi:outer membrane lipoprotein-sorting protein